MDKTANGGIRDPSIEFLRIFTMFGIVISHVTLTLLPGFGGLAESGAFLLH